MNLKLLKDSKVSKWMPAGLLIVVGSLSVPTFLHPGAFSQHWIDALQGGFLGLGLGIELMVVLHLAKMRRRS